MAVAHVFDNGICVTCRPVEAKFDPGQLRDPGGEDGGQWVKNPGSAAKAVAGDALKLAGKIDLDNDETLLGSGKVDGADGGIRLAAIGRDGQRTIRLGAGSEGYGKRDASTGARAWDGNPANPFADPEAAHRELHNEEESLDEEFQSASPSRQEEIEERLQEIRALQEEDDFNGTAALDEVSARRLADRIRPALDEAAEQEQIEDEAWSDLERLQEEANPDPEQLAKLRMLSRADATDAVVFRKGIIPGSEWGDVHFSVELDDPTVGPYLMLGVKPKDAPDDWGDTRDWQGRFDMAQADKFLRLLDKMTSAPLA